VSSRGRLAFFFCCGDRGRVVVGWGGTIVVVGVRSFGGFVDLLGGRGSVGGVCGWMGGVAGEGHVGV